MSRPLRTRKSVADQSLNCAFTVDRLEGKKIHRYRTRLDGGGTAARRRTLCIIETRWDLLLFTTVGRWDRAENFDRRVGLTVNSSVDRAVCGCRPVNFVRRVRNVDRYCEGRCLVIATTAGEKQYESLKSSVTSFVTVVPWCRRLIERSTCAQKNRTFKKCKWKKTKKKKKNSTITITACESL